MQFFRASDRRPFDRRVVPSAFFLFSLLVLVVMSAGPEESLEDPTPLFFIFFSYELPPSFLLWRAPEELLASSIFRIAR